MSAEGPSVSSRTSPTSADASHAGPLVRVTLAPDGRPIRAAARGRIEHPVAHVWATIYDTERFARFLPMVNHARRRGDEITFDLKFRVGFFAAGFQFTTLATYEAERWLDLRWIAGEPRDIRMRFSLTPIEGERASIVETEA